MKSEISHFILDSAGPPAILTVILKERQQTTNAPQNNRNEMKEVLEKIVLGQIRKLHKSAELTGKNFNVFSILDRERKEVTTHSAIIAELLNPHGSHSQGPSFLKLFLERLKLTIDVSNERTGFKVRTEEYVVDLEKEEKGYLDIVIESDNDDAYIVIENKTDTKDAERQLEKYCEHIEKIAKNTKMLLYLTPEGKGPEKLTLCGEGPVYQPCINKIRLKGVALMCLSYEEFIDEWLDACIKKVAHIPQIRETLHQYQMTVRKLTEKPTGQLPSEVEDILNKDILGENYKELKGKIIKGVQHELQCEFWKQLKERYENENRRPKFQDWTAKKEISSDIDLKKYIRDRSLVLTFSIPDSLQIDDNEHEVAFRVHYEKSREHSYFNYGFVLRRKDTLEIVEIKSKDKKDCKFKRYIKGYIEDRTFKYGWISWTYFQYKPRNFITESKETLIRRLVSEINLAFSKAREDNKA